MKKKGIILSLLLFFFIGGIFAEDLMKINVEGTEISIPLGWLAQYSKSPSLFFLYSPIEANDKFQENGNLVIESLPGAYTVKQYLNAAAKSLKTVFSNLTFVENGDNYHIYTGVLNGTELKQIQYVFIVKQKAYVLTFSSTPADFGRYSKVFGQIAGTFHVE